MLNGSRRNALTTTFLASTMLAGAPALAQEAAPTQTAQADAADAGLETIIVTATKRDENLQRVPVSIQALGTQKLEQLQVADFNDFSKFLPSVAYTTVGPGTTAIYFRGIASGENNNHSASLPSVGVYLDEQPVTTIQGALDIHIYDIARVEALAGPQGTLYGASSQSGTLRIITNKPDPSKFSASYDVEVNSVAHGDIGYVGEGYANIPLSDNAAVRIVGWYQHDAGYIDNVPATRTFPILQFDSNGDLVDLPGDDITIDNDAVAEEDYNEVDTYGARIALRIDLNDSWSVTPSIMGQKQEADGGFAYNPDVGDLKIERFYPEGSEDKWYQAALLIEGKIGNFDLTYSGAYFERKINSQSDYSDYSYFYDTCCGYSYYITDNDGNFINPSQRIVGIDRFTKQSHEVRIASPAEERFRFVGGLFYQRQTHNIEQNYIIDDLADAIAISTRPDNIWLTKQYRVDRDYAAFGEISFDITDKLTALGGIRVYRYDNSLEGFFGFGSGFSSRTGEAVCFGPPQVEGSPCTNLDKSTADTDFTYKLNLTYRIDDQKLVYGTISSGFRPGGINRRGTLDPYQADELTNYELGWKTSWFDNRVRWNGAVYYLEWTDIQFSFLGANGLTEIRNAGNAEVYGIETDLSWLVTDGLTLSGSAAYNDASTTTDYCLIANPEFDCSTPPGNEVLAPSGTRLPVTPKFKGNLTGRYDFTVGAFNAFVQSSLVHQSDAQTDLRLLERSILGKLPSFTTMDASAGFGGEAWKVEVYINNLWDERGQVTRYTQCAETVCGANVNVVPIQPMTIGIKFGQSF